MPYSRSEVAIFDDNFAARLQNSSHFPKARVGIGKMDQRSAYTTSQVSRRELSVAGFSFP